MLFTIKRTGTLCALAVLSLMSAAAEPQTEITVPGEDTRVLLRQESDNHGNETVHYEIQQNGQSFKAQADYQVFLRHGGFNPSGDVPPPRFESLASGEHQNLYIVQFVTQILPGYVRGVEQEGARALYFLPNYAQIVRMNAQVRDSVAQLPYVNWVGPYHPAYRLEEFLLDNADIAETAYPRLKYNIMLLESEKVQKDAVAARIKKLGGIVDRAHAGKFLLEATLTYDQLFNVVGWDEVLFIDRWSEGESDMDKAREIGGANYLEMVEGFTGQGVRGEVLDLGFNMDHVDFDHHPLISHTTVNSDSHGAACSGIIFGDGTGNPAARGMIPDAQGMVADWDVVSTGQPRYDHTGELVQAPYFAVFQTASVGSARTTEYGTISADTDAALFDFDILHCQSQSNAGDRMSRPQAWAKNVLSGGAVNHQDTLDRSDDCWCSGASIGPATDGRIKPDLASFYDSILTTTTGGTTAYTSSFGGTSGATPIICGHAGLVFQMWSEGIFGNTVDPGGTVFENRCHMTTAKALMINTAYRYDFSGQSHDLTRVHQGWGMPDLQRLYDTRENIIVIDEEDVLVPLATASYTAHVQAGTPELNVTMIFADPAGNPAATVHRINNLDLKVTSPSGAVYHGNNGLLDGNFSVAGGSPNTVDTVECVFIQDPEEGVWSVEVIAAEINQDSHVETGTLDADFALVISGALRGPGFSLSAPGSEEICAPASASFTLDIGQQLGYTNEITLSADGLPGATVSFSSNPIIPPATVTVTLDNTAAVTPGDYTLSLTGTASDQTKVLYVAVAVSDTIPLTTGNLVPANGAVEIGTQPTLSWDALAQVTDYRVEIADDPAFANILESGTSETNSYVVNNRLDALSCYYWRVRGENICGEGGWTGGGFTTLDQPDYFTEQITSSSDLTNTTLSLIPDSTGDYYRACITPAANLPTDPSGGTVQALGDDASNQVALTNPVNFYGTSYNALFVGSNGYITFNAGDTGYTATTGNHFTLPRISMVFDDLNPSAQGTISVLELADRTAVTYENVPEYNTTNDNTFQIEFLNNGEIHLTWLNVASNGHVAGISNGGGQPGDFLPSDLSAYGACDNFVPLGVGGCSLLDCEGDLNVNGTIDGEDLGMLYENWGVGTGAMDLNGDGLINLRDMIDLMSLFGDCP